MYTTLVQASKEVDRKSERLKYVVTAPGLVLIALTLGFLSIFVGVRAASLRACRMYQGLPVCAK